MVYLWKWVTGKVSAFELSFSKGFSRPPKKSLEVEDR